MGDIVERRQKQRELLDKIKKRAEAAMTASERLELDFRCTATRKEFVVHLERERADRVYKVVEISTRKTVSRTRSGSSGAPKALDVNANEIEWDSIECPYCDGGSGSIIKCRCGRLSCAGGGEEYEGKYRHICPWCGSKGYVTGRIEKLSGRMQDGGRIAPGAIGKELPPPTTGMLGEG